MRLFLLLSVLLVTTTSIAQRHTDPVDSWSVYPVPTHKDSLLKYNHSQKSWQLILKEGTVYATPEREPAIDLLPFQFKRTPNDFLLFGGKRTFVEVEDGYLLAFDNGEFGGNLYWISPGGRFRERITSVQVSQFIKRDSQLYAVEGLAHMGISQGSIIKIIRTGGEWKTKGYRKLPAAPSAITTDKKNNFVVITPTSLLRVNRDLSIDTLIDEGFWKIYLYPVSVLVKDDLVYVGMREGILRFSMVTRKQEWLMPR